MASGEPRGLHARPVEQAYLQLQAADYGSYKLTLTESLDSALWTADE